MDSLTDHISNGQRINLLIAIGNLLTTLLYFLFSASGNFLNRSNEILFIDARELGTRDKVIKNNLAKICYEHAKAKISIRFFNDREVRAVWDEKNTKW